MLKRQLTLGVLAVAALANCGGCNGAKTEPAPSKTTATPSSSNHGHDHPHSHGAGPHDGTLADWGGGKYHVEFTVNHDQQEATVYILGGDEKTPAPIQAAEIQLSITEPALQVALKAVPQEGDPQGSASRFVGNHAGLGVVREYAGTITGVIEGTPYSGDFHEEPH